MSNKSWHSLRDCPQSKELACSSLLVARVLPDGRIPSCYEHKEQETRPLHLSCSWCCHWALQMGDQSMPSLLPNFVTVMSLSQAFCLFNANYVWGFFVFRSLEAFGQGPPVDESLLLVFVISNNTCKHYVMSAHSSLQGKEPWSFHPKASAIWFGTHQCTKYKDCTFSIRRLTDTRLSLWVSLGKLNLFGNIHGLWISSNCLLTLSVCAMYLDGIV